MTVPQELLEALAAYTGEVKHLKPGRARKRWTRPRDRVLVEAEAAWKAQQLEGRERREAHDS
jgi:hypothetical protein